MNWSTIVLGLALIGLLAFIAHEERSKARDSQTQLDSLGRRYVWADAQRLAYARQLAAGKRAVEQDQGEGYRVAYQAGGRLRQQSVDQQQVETLERLAASGTLPASRTVVASQQTGRAHYDSIQQSALLLSLIDADSAHFRHRKAVERVGVLGQQLTDTTAKLGRVMDLVGDWVETRGILTGKNKRLKRGYNREVQPVPVRP